MNHGMALASGVADPDLPPDQPPDQNGAGR